MQDDPNQPVTDQPADQPADTGTPSEDTGVGDVGATPPPAGPIEETPAGGEENPAVSADQPADVPASDQPAQ